MEQLIAFVKDILSQPLVKAVLEERVVLLILGVAVALSLWQKVSRVVVTLLAIAFLLYAAKSLDILPAIWDALQSLIRG